MSSEKLFGNGTSKRSNGTSKGPPALPGTGSAWLASGFFLTGDL